MYIINLSVYVSSPYLIMKPYLQLHITQTTHNTFLEIKNKYEKEEYGTSDFPIAQ